MSLAQVSLTCMKSNCTSGGASNLVPLVMLPTGPLLRQMSRNYSMLVIMVAKLPFKMIMLLWVAFKLRRSQIRGCVCLVSALERMVLHLLKKELMPWRKVHVISNMALRHNSEISQLTLKLLLVQVRINSSIFKEAQSPRSLLLISLLFVGCWRKIDASKIICMLRISSLSKEQLLLKRRLLRLTLLNLSLLKLMLSLPL